MIIPTDRPEVISRIRDYQYYRDALGDDDAFLAKDLPRDAFRALEEADRLVEAVMAAMAIKRYEL